MTLRIPRVPQPKPPDPVPQTGIGVNFGELFRRHLEKKKQEPKKP